LIGGAPFCVCSIGSLHSTGYFEIPLSKGLFENGFEDAISGLELVRILSFRASVAKPRYSGRLEYSISSCKSFCAFEGAICEDS